MRILVHDYAGHPFQVQLSRSLAKRGHQVLHTFCASLSTTPQGALKKTSSDPASFEVTPIDLGYIIEKSNFKKVFFKEDPAYAAKLVEVADRFRPDIILSANTPLRVNSALLNYSDVTGASFVFWVQDLFGEAAARILPEKLGALIGGTAGRYMKSLEHQLLSRSDGIVLIAEDFKNHIPKTNKPVHVIENWAPLEEMPVRPRGNKWAVRHELENTTNFIYSGTLGMKHNPDLLVGVAEHFKNNQKVRTIVISQGQGQDYLKKKKEELGLDNLLLLPFQPFEDLPDVLASADALMAILEPDAGVFSVPSKVLSYLCAARPILMAVPPENLASKIVDREKAGIVVAPTDTEAFVAGADEIANHPERALQMGKNARHYAEATFDIESITKRFEAVFREVRSVHGD